MERVVRTGRRAILSACWYLDHLSDEWQDMYACNPRAFNGTDDEYARVIGGHSSMWGERVDENNIMSRSWPRTSAGTPGAERAATNV